MRLNCSKYFRADDGRKRCAILSLFKIVVFVGVCTSFGNACHGQRVSAPESGPSASVKPSKSLPRPFASVLPEIKAKSHIPILLPSKLAPPFVKAKHAVAEEASDERYSIALYYELGIGDAGFAAFFAAEATPNYEPDDLGDATRVTLAHGLVGFFRPVSCGGSCAPANIWWKQGATLYQIQLRLPSNLRALDQQRAMTAAANSAILAGPR